MKKQLDKTFEEIISLENLFLAWQEFLVGKKKKRDVQEFSRNLADNILALHEDLANKTYRHGGYESFYVNDPKRRHIHKASVRDRLLHHAIYRILYPFFDKTFISDSYSCRLEKGTHRALNRFRAMARKVGRNHTRTAWVLKCDIKKFFARIDQKVLLDILREYILDENILWLLKNVIKSFMIDCHPRENGDPAIGCLDSPVKPGNDKSRSVMHGNDKNEIATATSWPRNDKSGVGLPLGNLTSQLFANVYMNVFDQWVKHSLKIKYYLRYADDFVFLSLNREWLLKIIPQIEEFLMEELKLTLHPKKIILKTFSSGVDFLGWVHFPDHRLLRKTAQNKMLTRIKTNPVQETFQSYSGLLRHGNSFKIKQKLKEQYWLWRK